MAQVTTSTQSIPPATHPAPVYTSDRVQPPRYPRVAAVPAKAPNPATTPRIKPEVTRRVDMNM